MNDAAMVQPTLPNRVAPALTPVTAFFWEAGREGALLILRCRDCRYMIHPPYPQCPTCLSRHVEPHAVSGLGTLYSFTVNHHQWAPRALPYVIGLVELVEQPDLRLTTNIVECAPDAVTIGMEVEVCFEQLDDVWLPQFRPASS